MSAASKKNDPFNFDDLYRQAGVEDLFVKKTMGELKQKPPGPGLATAPQPSRSVAAVPTPPSAQGTPASALDIDFLSSIATPSGGGTPSNLSKHSSAANLVAASPQLNLQQPRQPPQASTNALDDPFALFQEVPGAAPVQRHTPPPGPSASPRSGTGNLLDFDDGQAFPAATPVPVAAPPLAAAAPATAAPSTSAISADQPLAPPARLPHLPHGEPSQPQPLSSVAAQPPPSPPPPPPAYDEHTAHHPAPSGPSPRPLGTAAIHSSSPPYRGRSSSGGGGADTPVDYGHHRPQQHHPPDGYAPSSSSASPPIWGGHSAPVPAGATGGGAGGISSYLKAFGKKAVRVAKAGLAQLEHALEGLDAAAAAQQQQQPGTAGHGTRWSGAGGNDADGSSVSHDEALAWAVRLGDLAPHAQQQELAQMAPPLRRKVIEVLREQVRMEHEAARGGVAASGPAPGPHLGPGTGHGAVLDAPATGATAPGHGHGAPVPPPPAAGAHPGHLGQDAERWRQQQHAADGPAAADIRRPVAPPPAPPQSQPEPQAVHHDLLSIGSGEAAPPAPAPLQPQPVVDDLLGFGDDGHAVPPAVAASPAPPRSPAPPAASPAAAPATAAAPAVHVDDMDDFFSGGCASGSGTAAGAARAAPGAMHTSSSAPSLGGRGAAAASSSASVADFLHDDGLSGLGGDGPDVDVSGYQDLYRGEQGDANEPELRKRLRAQREAAKHAKMKAALAEKLAMEAEEAARREQQVALKEAYKTNIEAWKNKNKGNIRGLLGSLHTVLWADSGWAPVSVGDLLEPAQVKKVYMRANLLVHPDKVRQRNGSAEQVAIADMVFDVLKDAWNIFR